MLKSKKKKDILKKYAICLFPITGNQYIYARRVSFAKLFFKCFQLRLENYRKKKTVHVV